MAAPSYTEDLSDVTLAESTTNWSAYGGGASGLSASPDLAMQGTNCVDKQISNADKGQYYDNGSGITLGTGDHVWVWLFCGTPGLTDLLSNKGASVLVGTASNAYCQYHVEGNDTYGAAGRVARCYPIDYSVRTASTGVRSVTGSPGANPQVFGGGLVTTASVKGANVGIDAIRYGTGAYLTAGELISAGDASDNPCTFSGFQTQNDNSSNRWGILTSVGGSYELQGSFVIGQDNTQTATLCRFEDSDVNIAIVDTPHASSTFTKILIDHASTVCNWTNVNITALGTNTKGFVSTNISTNPTFNVTGGTWTGLDGSLFGSNATFIGTTFRQCGSFTLGNSASTFTDCIFDRATEAQAISINDLENLDGCHFISDGTGYAVNRTSTISTNTTYTWNCTSEGYASTDGSTGNEVLRVNVNPGITLTINVSAGATIPTVHNVGTGTVNVVSGQVTLTVTVKDIDTGSVIENARVLVVADTGGNMTPGDVIIDKVLTNASGIATDTRSYSGNQPITGRVRKASSGSLYKTSPIAGTIDAGTGLSLTVQMIPDE